MESNHSGERIGRREKRAAHMLGGRVLFLPDCVSLAWLLLACLLVCQDKLDAAPASSGAQDAIFRGKVTDAATSRPLPFAALRVAGRTARSTTDGTYLLACPPGDACLWAESAQA